MKVTCQLHNPVALPLGKSGIVSFRPQSHEGFKSYPFSSTRKKGSSQASWRVHPFSSTAIIHDASPSMKQNTKVSKYTIAKSYLVSLNDVTFDLTPTHE